MFNIEALLLKPGVLKYHTSHLVGWKNKNDLLAQMETSIKVQVKESRRKDVERWETGHFIRILTEEIFCEEAGIFMSVDKYQERIRSCLSPKMRRDWYNEFFNDNAFQQALRFLSKQFSNFHKIRQHFFDDPVKVRWTYKRI